MQQKPSINDFKLEVIKKDANPFKDMSFVKFWIVSTLFRMSFAISITVSYISIGSVELNN